MHIALCFVPNAEFWYYPSIMSVGSSIDLLLSPFLSFVSVRESYVSYTSSDFKWLARECATTYCIFCGRWQGVDSWAREGKVVFLSPGPRIIKTVPLLYGRYIIRNISQNNAVRESMHSMYSILYIQPCLYHVVSYYQVTSLISTLVYQPPVSYSCE